MLIRDGISKMVKVIFVVRMTGTGHGDVYDKIRLCHAVYAYSAQIKM